MPHQVVDPEAFRDQRLTDVTRVIAVNDDLAWLEHKDDSLVETSRTAGPWEYAVRL